tara:strand:- start:2649 stop:2945 length:297 start_codon:yes stop_codon:yes gene_type:complete
MDRYSNIGIQKDKKGRRFKSTVNLPIIEPHEDDTYIMGQVGDRLDTLAYKYYKMSSYWWIIARANGIGAGDFVVPIGKQLRIPHNVEYIVKTYNELNN